VTKYGFADQAGRLSRARSALMAPHRDGEEKSFIEALSQCRHIGDKLSLYGICQRTFIKLSRMSLESKN